MSSAWRPLAALLLAAWAFGVGYKTGRGRTWDDREELRVARRAVAAFHEALHACVDSLARRP